MSISLLKIDPVALVTGSGIQGKWESTQLESCFILVRESLNKGLSIDIFSSAIP